MELKVIAGPACAPSLVEGVCKRISELKGGVFQLTPCSSEQFMDGEELSQIRENIRGADVYIIQSTNPPEENHKFLLMMLQAAALASACRVTAVLPYMGGLRQDRKDKPRVPITAKLNSKSIEDAMIAASQRHVMILHPHFSQIQGFFDVSSDLLYPTDIFVRCARQLTGGDFSEVVPVAPDAGAAKMAEIYARHLNTDSFAVGDKRRDKNDRVVIRDVIGEVKGKIAMSFEDIIDTGGTLIKLSVKLREKGAKGIYLFATHGVFAPGAVENLLEAGVDRIVVTNSIFHPEGTLPEFIKVVDCGSLIGEAIYRNHINSSISSMSGMFFPKKS